MTRILFLFFLVMAFAQPFSPAQEQKVPNQKVVFYIDNSYSMMSLVDPSARALDVAIQFSEEVIKLFPIETRYKIVTNDFSPFSNNYKNQTEILDLLSQIKPSPIARTFHEVSQRLNSSNDEIFWISDFQKSTFGIPNVAQIDTLSLWHLVPIPLKNVSNVFVDSVYLENPFVIQDQRNELHVRLRNVGAVAKNNQIAKLVINGILAGTSSVNLEPNSTSIINFELLQGVEGRNKAVVSFEDYPVNFDNQLFISLNSSEKIKIVEVGNNNGYVEKVFGNTSLFSFRSYKPENIDLGILSSADLIVINNLESIDESIVSTIKTYLSNYGKLLLIPSKNSKPDIFLPFIGSVFQKSIEKDFLDISRPDLGNPFFENVFEEQSESLSMPHAKPLFDATEDSQAILKLKNGLPFLFQKGNIFVVTTPLEEEFTDFQTHALFVPVMYRIASFGHKADQKLYYSLSENLVVLKSDSLQDDRPIKLVGEEEYVATQQKIEDRVMLEIPKSMINPGFYYPVQNQDTIGLIAFNFDKSESLFAQYDPQEVKAMMGGGGNISFFSDSAINSLDNQIREKYLGTELWKLALFLALLFLLAEVLIIRFVK